MVKPLQCAIFKGDSRATFLNRRDITGDVMTQVEGAYQYVLEKMNIGADLGGLVRRDVYELPEWSVREIITNAVVHRSYVERSSVQVALYDDRLEVSSPDGIVRGFSLDRALSGQSRPGSGHIRRWGIGTAVDASDAVPVVHSEPRVRPAPLERENCSAVRVGP